MSRRCEENDQPCPYFCGTRPCRRLHGEPEPGTSPAVSQCIHGVHTRERCRECEAAGRDVVSGTGSERKARDQAGVGDERNGRNEAAQEPPVAQQGAEPDGLTQLRYILGIAADERYSAELIGINVRASLKELNELAGAAHQAAPPAEVEELVSRLRSDAEWHDRLAFDHKGDDAEPDFIEAAATAREAALTILALQYAAAPAAHQAGSAAATKDSVAASVTSDRTASLSVDSSVAERKDRERRCVVCAANRHTDADLRVWLLLGPRHWGPTMRHQAKMLPFDAHALEWEQGFIDQRGEFLTREEAWKVAEAAGQIFQRVGGDTINGGRLFSENLY